MQPDIHARIRIVVRRVTRRACSFQRALLCCEEDIYKWNYTIDTGEDGTGGRTSHFWIVYQIVIPFILGFGIFGNALALIILIGQSFRGIAYLYLSGIATAHAGVLVSWIPICYRLGHGMRNDYPSVFYHAHLELVALNTFSTASTLIMTCLIVDRYVFVFFPARIRTGNVRRNVKSFILSSFVFGFSVSAPLAAMRVVHEDGDETGQYFSLRENKTVTRNGLWNTYIWTMEIASRICPTIIFFLLNGLVVKRFMKLNAKKKKFQSVSQKFRTTTADVSLLNRNRGYREEQNLAIMTTVMVLCFFVTMIPSLMLSIMYQNYRTLNIDYPLFRTISRVFELCNFSIGIFIYLSCSKQFREELFKIIRGKCNETADQEIEQTVGENDDFSRHGTTVRLTPELTKLNSPSSPSKHGNAEEDRELYVVDAV